MSIETFIGNQSTAFWIQVEIEPDREVNVYFIGEEDEGLPQAIIFDSDVDQMGFERVMDGACTHDGYLLNVGGEMQPSDLVSAIVTKGLKFKIIRQPESGKLADLFS